MSAFLASSPAENAEPRESAEQMQAQWTRCEKWKKDLMHSSPRITFIRKHLALLNCPISNSNVLCAPCGPTRAGGFGPETGTLLLCQNRFADKKHMEDTIAHELIHMYDHCRFKLDWFNLRHVACTEIRAASLSGDCRASREFMRAQVGFTKQHQSCVRRRALLSVRGHPNCPDDATAERVVSEVWESCFNDTRPFDEIY
ncbi:hypothetical protein EXIGLDRAFT_649894 [Exidia glandulosa HHB12029]|uniref:Mitochondrial inner membrane protease ATP23 n=1 Tax=Exidia glandulosa HHB12029 TaxID=1314781 RepID=A0A165G086_EXIGL|nr:hypothetical protein EXIGLDRAFT_656356 [Exidia glandulosa HHB12029]KZV89794.1 hypothetical protein EXIGLDRAFT_649894 [Exidia glandulosa HHB12029]